MLNCFPLLQFLSVAAHHITVLQNYCLFYNLCLLFMLGLVLQALSEIYPSMPTFVVTGELRTGHSTYSGLGTTSRAKRFEALAVLCAGFSLAFLI